MKFRSPSISLSLSLFLCSVFHPLPFLSLPLCLYSPTVSLVCLSFFHPSSLAPLVTRRRRVVFLSSRWRQLQIWEFKIGVETNRPVFNGAAATVSLRWVVSRVRDDKHVVTRTRLNCALIIQLGKNVMRRWIFSYFRATIYQAILMSLKVLEVDYKFLYNLILETCCAKEFINMMDD